MIVTKTVCQHSRRLPKETMDFLCGIAEDYAKVKSAVYERYSGIRNVYHINSVFTVQKEMRSCGLRRQLNLPSVYYELAVAEAVANIKVVWSAVKNKIRDVIRFRDDLSVNDHMYINTVLKYDNILAAVLNHYRYNSPKNLEGIDVDTKRLNSLICRLVRRHITKPGNKGNRQFRMLCNGYGYKDNGVYFVSRIRGQRVFIPLKDSQTTTRQIHVCVRDNSIDIYIPVDVETQKPNDYDNVIYVHIGNGNAMTLSNGHVYGKDLCDLVNPETDRLYVKNIERGKVRLAHRKCLEAGEVTKAKRIEENNLGSKKYDEQKRRIRAKTQNYINAEINRMLSEEKPRLVVITRSVTKNVVRHFVKDVNRRVNRGFAGYVRKRLTEKCRFCGIEIVSISGKDTAKICSKCGAVGIREKYDFRCESCGYVATAAENSALNIKKKAISEGFC